MIMGMGAEMLEDMMFEDFFYEMFEEDFKRRRTYWVTQDGRKLDIEDMSSDHIQNVINYLERQGKVAPDLMYEVLRLRKICKVK